MPKKILIITSLLFMVLTSTFIFPYQKSYASTSYEGSAMELIGEREYIIFQSGNGQSLRMVIPESGFFSRKIALDSNNIVFDGSQSYFTFSYENGSWGFRTKEYDNFGYSQSQIYYSSKPIYTTLSSEQIHFQAKLLPEPFRKAVNPVARVLLGTGAQMIIKSIGEKGGMKITNEGAEGIVRYINGKSIKDQNRQVQKFISDLHEAEKNLKEPPKPGWKKYALDPMLWLTGMDIILEVYNAVKNNQSLNGFYDDGISRDGSKYLIGSYCKYEPINTYTQNIFCYAKEKDGTLVRLENTASNMMIPVGSKPYVIVRESYITGNNSTLFIYYDGYYENGEKIPVNGYVFINHFRIDQPSQLTMEWAPLNIPQNAITYEPIPEVEKIISERDITSLPDEIEVIAPEEITEENKDKVWNDYFFREPPTNGENPYVPTNPVDDDRYGPIQIPDKPVFENPNQPIPEEPKPDTGESNSSWWEWLFSPLVKIFDLLFGLVSSIMNGLISLFIPDGEFFQKFFDDVHAKFESKIPIIPQLSDFFGAIEDVSTSGEPPKFEVTMPEKYGGGTFSVIDFSAFDQYRVYILNFIRFIAWFVFLKRLYNRIPRMIY